MFDINDVIKECSGEGFMRLYNVVLLIFKCDGCIKYVYIILLLLVKVNFLYLKINRVILYNFIRFFLLYFLMVLLMLGIMRF